MTVEERAQTVIAEIGRYSESSEIKALIAQALRDQIEECARLVEQAGLISLRDLAKAIRALAAPGEENNNQEKRD